MSVALACGSTDPAPITASTEPLTGLPSATAEGGVRVGPTSKEDVARLALGGPVPEGWRVLLGFDLASLRTVEVAPDTGDTVLSMVDLQPVDPPGPAALAQDAATDGRAALALLGFVEAKIHDRGRLSDPSRPLPWWTWSAVRVDPDGGERTATAGATVLRLCPDRWLFVSTERGPTAPTLLDHMPRLPPCPHPAEPR